MLSLPHDSPPVSSLRASARACPACPDPDGERPLVPSAVEGSGVERTFRPCRSGSHSCPKPFICHTCRKSPCKPNHCHRSDIALPQVLSLPHIQDSPGGTSCTAATPLSRVQPTEARPLLEGLPAIDYQLSTVDFPAAPLLTRLPRAQFAKGHSPLPQKVLYFQPYD